jgi:murein DD-endopeptidase MepM/ murein hydrolase activator NlpD
MKKFFVVILLCIFAFFIQPNFSVADTASDLQQKISDTQKQRDILVAQQQKLQAELDTIGQSKNTLQTNIKQLDTTKAKLSNDIKLTQNKISSANLNITSLQNSVQEKQSEVDTHQKAVATSLKKLSEYDGNSLLSEILNDKDINEVWADRGTLQSLQISLLTEISSLQEAQKVLTVQKTEKEKVKEQLVGLKTELGGQKAVVETTQADKNKLLAQTKNQEALFQKMLADNIAQEKKFEEEQFNYESQLKATIDPNSIPAVRKGVLAFPLSNPIITQYFGAGAAAKRLYVSGSHGGVDFKASIGTPIYAALSGVVTDTEPSKYRNGCQYGKWVLLNHNNGLSTIYGHFSTVLVSPGQTVTTGQIIGYSGATGYATGPHLHFGLYITSAIRIVDARSLGSTNCAGIKTVAAPHDAYLDPLAYLPPLN